MSPTTTMPAGAAADAGATRPHPGGPVLAVCGLCGGAGASTLAFLIARASAQSVSEPVLVCDTGGPTAGLAAYAGVESPRTLAGAADALAAGEALAEGLYVDLDAGLRVIARRPETNSQGEERAMGRLLADARTAHGLTVVDCGTLARPADVVVLEAATHIAWVLPATEGGMQRARRLLDLFPGDGRRRELVVARADAGGRRAPVSGLGTLADQRRGPLVLMPDVPDLAEGGLEPALDKASVALDAIRAVVRR